MDNFLLSGDKAQGLDYLAKAWTSDTEKQLLEQRVAKAWAENAFPTHALVYVAVSGGADSMALLHLLLALAPKLNLTVRACHVDHGMRGKVTRVEAAFVRDCCRTLGVPLTIFSARAEEATTPPPNAGETWARNLRYAYFEKLLVEENSYVATAHTLNDQAETLLFRLARGTGVHGAAGIRQKRQQYLRPLLGITRAETEQYCAFVGQRYVTDETNLETKYARNHLRKHAVTSLCNANEGALHHVGQFCERMAEMDDYFARHATALLAKAGEAAAEECVVSQSAVKSFVATSGASIAKQYSIAVLRAAEPLILEAAMYQLVCPLRDPEQKYTDAMCNLVQAGTGAVQVVQDVRFVAKNGLLCQEQLQMKTVKVAQKEEYYPVLAGEYSFCGGYQVKIEQITPEIMEKIHLVHKKDLKNYADYDKIVASLVLRCRAQGDTFSPVGRGLTKTVKKLHNELGIPEAERGCMPLLATGHTVVWLWGQGFAEGYAPDANSKRILKITEEKITEE